MVVFHDGFRFDAWHDFFAEHDFKNVILDAHWYLGMTPGGALGDCDLTYMEKILRDHAYNLEQMEKVVPVVVGEWCLSHNLPEGMTDLEKQLSYRMIGDAQLSAWEHGTGYFFWSYKLISEPDGWDFRRCVEKGWMPSNVETGR